MRAFFIFDLQHAIRSLRATPVITAVAVLSLALGIGANTALFSILNGLVLKSLPVKAPQDLALIEGGSWTNPIWEGLRDRAPKLVDGAFAWAGGNFDLAATGQRDTVPGAYASGAIFDVLGINAELGRTFTPADDVRGGGPDGRVVVISHRLWQTRFGGEVSALGQPMLVNRVPFTIIGVTPPGFLGVDVGSAKDVFLPLANEATIRGKESLLNVRAAWWLDIMIRRRQGQSIEQAALALNSVRRAVREETIPPDWDATNLASYLNEDLKLRDASNGFETTLRTKYAQPLTIIMFVVAAVLLIACANIANLLLARATARRHEMSLRLALGASRFRLVCQLLAESAILAFAGGIGGLFLAKFGGALLVRQLGTSATSVTLDLSLDWRVLAFTAAVALVTTLLFGLAPAAGLAHVSPNDALKEQTRSVAGDRRFGIRNVLVVTQVSLSLALVVGAGLFVRSFTSLATMPLGFDPSHLLVINVDASRFVRASTAQERLVAMLSGFFGVLALFLAALGLYGVTSHSVNRRRSEIAVRMALGATAGAVIQMVLRRVIWLVLAGVALGVAFSLWAGNFIVTLLYGLQPRDPWTMAGAAMVLLGAGVIAGWLPARRAAKLDPTTVLRD